MVRSYARSLWILALTPQSSRLHSLKLELSLPNQHLAYRTPKVSTSASEATRMHASASEQDKEIQIHEKAHFAEDINQPIISFRKMIQAGWGIHGEDQVLTYGGGPRQIRIPLGKKSFIAEGFARAIQTAACMVRVLEAKLMKELEDKAMAQSGWTGG